MAEKTNANMLFANFNQDFECVFILLSPFRRYPHFGLTTRCISTGTRKGCSMTNCDSFGRIRMDESKPRTYVVTISSENCPESPYNTYVLCHHQQKTHIPPQFHCLILAYQPWLCKRHIINHNLLRFSRCPPKHLNSSSSSQAHYPYH